ncbi:MAG: D-alanyl-D-alanine carboxypeptidase family protein [Gammaproteobacteria bacterium]|nr:D-alanyl-D-alanine carboxypeptidase family protein [Gammaproteobacteria bacterium]
MRDHVDQHLQHDNLQGSNLPNHIQQRYQRRIDLIHAELNIHPDYANSRNLPLQIEAATTIIVATDNTGKTLRLSPVTQSAWCKMQASAERENIKLIMVSGYRSVEYQRELIVNKRTKGQPLEKILQVLAAPGYSEHHTGRAIDLTTTDCPPCVEYFEKTNAYTWLQNNAANFGFSLSYPRDNPYGFIYEPWHWSLREDK